MSNNAVSSWNLTEFFNAMCLKKINMNFGINTYKEQVISHQKHLLKVIR